MSTSISKSELAELKVGDFIIVAVMPVVLAALVELARKFGNAPRIVYNARRDEPSIIGAVNAALYQLRETLPNRHSRLDANFALNGSLRSTSRDKLVASGELRGRLVSMIRQSIDRPDVRKLVGVGADKLAALSPDKLAEIYAALADGALNVEDYGFYRCTCDNATSKYKSPIAKRYAAQVGAAVEKVGRGGDYRVEVANVAGFVAATRSYHADIMRESAARKSESESESKSESAAATSSSKSKSKSKSK